MYCKSNQIFVMILVIVMFFFTGCDSADNRSLEPSIETVETRPVEEALQQVEITLGLWEIGSKPGQLPSFKNQVDEMLTVLNNKAQADGLNVRVSIEWISSPIATNLIEQGVVNRCDAYIAGFSQVSILQEQGYLREITDLIREYAPTYYNIITSNGLLGMLMEDTEHEPWYFMPTNYVNTDVYAVMMERSIAEKYDIQISTLSDYVEALKKIKSGGEPKNPGFIWPENWINESLKEAGYYRHTILKNSPLLLCKYCDTDYSIYPISNMIEYEDALKNYINLYKDKLTYTANGSLLELALGNTYSTLTLMGNFLTVKHSFRKDKEYVLFPLSIDKQKQHLHGCGLVINSSCENPERVLMFLEWMYSSQENMDIWCYGGFQEGTNPYYTLDDKGKISYTQTNNPFYSWMDTAGRLAVCNTDHLRAPHYLPETYLDDYKQIINMKLQEMKLDQFEIPYNEGSVEFDKFFEVHNQLYQDAQKSNTIYQEVLQISTNPNFDIQNHINKMKDTGLEDAAKGLSKLLNETIDE